ncbi:hypothetical protein BB737_00380 [Mycobacterium avium subsp. hominissuis]|uniref:Uncharacterized protein n=2 Tax=Mycobacterium avium complex (MAC) TaxID=120793 RepID=A0A2A3LEH0_MYCAV|nr:MULTISPECIES: hypothetical protein [Mycobacterium]MBZ4632016.1 hypothetical protein [Mycobacterium avium subsp. hominissuis]ORA44509.1 hypothetical protein BST19_21305 [Mycobacterium bouchedurhonense]PBJ40955.1 hypothetical protein XV03_00940 [Mycobacterium avium subsp. hominissuis]PBJ67771.1 hypothetical protein BB737_00380 [Mycobacterium avium subsp. hominissuis]
MSGDGEQVGLDLWPQEHDLPPRWDGLPVEWGEWEDTAGVFVCPPPRKPDRCDHCDSTRAPLISAGRIWTDPKTAPPAVGQARFRHGRHLVGSITAFRCPDCGHDSVLDPNGQHWDLDPTDYTDGGSWDNTRSERLQ